MRNTFFKKLVALTMAGCLVLSVFPCVAFSDETEEMRIEAPAAEPIATIKAEPTPEPTAQSDATVFNAENSRSGWDSDSSEGEWNNTPHAIYLYSLGGTATLDKSTAETGATVTITIIPPDGKALKSVTVTGSSSNTSVSVSCPTDITTWADELSCTFTMPDEDVNVSIEYQALISFTVNGAVTRETKAVPGSTFYAWIAKDSTIYANSAYWRVTRGGTTSVVNASTVIQADDVYQLVWTLSGSILGISASCTADELPDTTFFMYSIGDGATVTVTHIINGQSVSCAVTSANYYALTLLNEVAGLDATSSSGATRKWYTASNTEVGAWDTIALKPAVYVSNFFISVAEDSANGNVTVDLTAAKAGDTVTITVKPNTDYELDALTVVQKSDSRKIEVNEAGQDGNGNSLYTFTMPGDDVQIACTFKQKVIEYKITIDSELENGSVTTDKAAAAEGNSVKLTITPDSGYRLKTLSVTGRDGGEVSLTENADGTYTFIMPAQDVTVSAEFEKLYALTIDGGAKDYITIDADTYAAGDTVTFVSSLPKGKVFTELEAYYTLNKVQYMEEIVNNSFTMPAADVKVTVEMADGYTIKFKFEGENEDCYVADVTPKYACGNYYAQTGNTVGLLLYCRWNEYSCNCTVQTDAGDAVEGAIDALGAYSFTMPADNVTVTVTFSKATPSYVITIPSNVSLNDGQSMTITASNVQNLVEGQSIIVGVSSQNGGKLKSGESEIAYTYEQSLSFSENGSQNLALTIGEGEIYGKPAGTYTDTLNFSVSLSGAAGE